MRAALALLAAAVAVIIGGAGVASARQAGPVPASQQCPPRQPAPHCFRGKVIIWDPKGDPNAAGLVMEDGYGAPMLWVDMYGLYSGGEPVCVTGLQFQLLACLGGPWSQKGASPLLTLYDHGRPVSVTVGQLEQLEALLAAGFTPRDVLALHRVGL